MMEVEDMVRDGNWYMSQSPLNRNNAKRIDKILSQYKIQTNRVGPSASATFYDTETIKIGNDEVFWIKRNGKWTKCASQ